jgi:hypothetical protein
MFRFADEAALLRTTLVKFHESKSKLTRQGCIIILYTVLASENMNIFKKLVVEIQRAILEGITTADQETREGSAKCFELFAVHFPQEHKVALSNLDSRIQKFLEKISQEQKTPSPKSLNSTRKNLGRIPSATTSPTASVTGRAGSSSAHTSRVGSASQLNKSSETPGRKVESSSTKSESPSKISNSSVKQDSPIVPKSRDSSTNHRVRSITKPASDASDNGSDSDCESCPEARVHKSTSSAKANHRAISNENQPKAENITLADEDRMLHNSHFKLKLGIVETESRSGSDSELECDPSKISTNCTISTPKMIRSPPKLAPILQRDKKAIPPSKFNRTTNQNAVPKASENFRRTSPLDRSPVVSRSPSGASTCSPVSAKSTPVKFLPPASLQTIDVARMFGELASPEASFAQLVDLLTRHGVNLGFATQQVNMFYNMINTSKQGIVKTAAFRTEFVRWKLFQAVSRIHRQLEKCPQTTELDHLMTSGEFQKLITDDLGVACASELVRDLTKRLDSESSMNLHDVRSWYAVKDAAAAAELKQFIDEQKYMPVDMDANTIRDLTQALLTVSSGWQARIDTMLMIPNFFRVAQGTPSIIDIIVDTAPILADVLSIQIMDTKSEVTGTAAEMISFLAVGLGQRFILGSNILIPKLVERSGCPNSVIRRQMLVTSEAVVRSAHSVGMLRSVLNLFKETKSTLVQQCCSEVLLHALESWPMDEYRQSFPKLGELIVAGLSMKNLETRETCARCFVLLTRFFPTQTSNMRRAFDARTSQLIQRIEQSDSNNEPSSPI